MSRETKKFEAEVTEILNLMINSLYSHKEIFLRELISNAADALEKLRFEEISHKEWKTTDEEKHIRLEADKEKNILSIKDNGIGMTAEEVMENIGTIARSGTKEFMKQVSEAKENPELIGQFGVGFYSVFMVAEKVVVHTQKAGTDQGTWWESTGAGEYSIESVPRGDGHGTTITIHLKKGDDEASQDNYAETHTLKSLIKKYSDFIEFPIKMLVEEEEPEQDKDGKAIEGKFKKITKDETLNSRKALWLKPANDISKEQYNEFYKHIASDWTDPQDVIHYKAEGTQEFATIMYIPSSVPFDYNYRGSKHGLSLYVRRVFIMANCEELLPPYFRFVKGIIDSDDLSLNVSREILQQDKQIQAIKKALTNRLLKYFKTKLEKEREEYETFWGRFGATVKEGISTDFANKEKLQDLCLFRSSHSEKLTTLKEYIGRMPDGQKEIYYITGESLSQVQESPYLEKLHQKGYEILFLTDPVDDWVMQGLTKYDDKMLRSVTKEGLELDSEEEKEKIKKETEEKTKDLKPLIDTIQEALSEKIKEVKISNRLVDSPVCLVSGAYDPSAHMERMMESLGQSMPQSKRILEINSQHPVFTKMTAMSKDTQKVWAEILYNQALLNEGSPIKNPLQFSKQISNLMLEVPT